jgi:hypothetical protein
MKGEGKKIFKQPIPLKVALKYGYSKDEKRLRWFRLVQEQMAERFINPESGSYSAFSVVVRIENWLMKQSQEKWERRFKRRKEKWLAKRNKENVINSIE